jgi:hypothetical protein
MQCKDKAKAWNISQKNKSKKHKGMNYHFGPNLAKTASLSDHHFFWYSPPCWWFHDRCECQRAWRCLDLTHRVFAYTILGPRCSPHAPLPCSLHALVGLEHRSYEGQHLLQEDSWRDHLGQHSKGPSHQICGSNAFSWPDIDTALVFFLAIKP